MPTSSSHLVQSHSEPLLTAPTSQNNYLQPFPSQPHTQFGRLSFSQNSPLHHSSSFLNIQSDQRSFISPKTPIQSKQRSRSPAPSPYKLISSSLPISESSHIQSRPHTSHPSSPSFYPSPNHSSIPEVRTIIEQLSVKTPPRARARLQSDGEQQEWESHVVREQTYRCPSPTPAPHRARGNTFSGGKRRRLGKSISQHGCC